MPPDGSSLSFSSLSLGSMLRILSPLLQAQPRQPIPSSFRLRHDDRHYPARHCRTSGYLLAYTYQPRVEDDFVHAWHAIG